MLQLIAGVARSRPPEASDAVVVEIKSLAQLPTRFRQHDHVTVLSRNHRPPAEIRRIYPVIRIARECLRMMARLSMPDAPSNEAAKSSSVDLDSESSELGLPL